MSDDCIEFQGAPSGRGYGYVQRQGRTWRAHRLAWTEANGPIPEGLHVLHHCDNKLCVNVRHLFLGTNADNVADREAKGRGKRPDLRGIPRPDMHGEKHYNAKLTSAQVAEIRAIGIGRLKANALAKHYGVERKTIWRIWRRETWASE
jgi:hypothetical protein